MVGKQALKRKKLGDDALKMEEDSKAFKSSVVSISGMLSICVSFVLASFLVPDLSQPMKHVCWQTAMLFFVVAFMFVQMHLQEFHWAPTEIEI